jgi:hypothetical protein
MNSILLLKLTVNPAHVGTSMRSFDQARSNDWVHPSPCVGSDMRNDPNNCHFLMGTCPTIARKTDISYHCLHELSNAGL